MTLGHLNTVMRLHSYFQFSELLLRWYCVIRGEKGMIELIMWYLSSFPPEVHFAFLKYHSFSLKKLKEKSKYYIINSDMWIWSTLYLAICWIEVSGVLLFNTFEIRLFIREAGKVHHEQKLVFWNIHQVQTKNILCICIVNVKLMACSISI